MTSCNSTGARRDDRSITSLPSSVGIPKSEPLQSISFCLRLCLPSPANHAPRSLTLVYTSLEEDGSDLIPGETASVALHRVWNPWSASPGEAVYAGTDPLTAACCSGVGAGFRFEAYFGEERAAEGVVHRDRERLWEMDCWLGPGVSEVRVVGKGVYLRRSAWWSPRARRRRREPRFFSNLHRIPEEGLEEVDSQTEATAMYKGKENGVDGRAAAEDGYGGCGRWLTSGPEDGWETGSSQELRWVVDMGVWAVCVGVGLMLSGAVTSGLRKGFFLL